MVLFGESAEPVLGDARRILDASDIRRIWDADANSDIFFGQTVLPFFLDRMAVTKSSGRFT